MNKCSTSEHTVFPSESIVLECTQSWLNTLILWNLLEPMLDKVFPRKGHPVTFFPITFSLLTLAS